MSELIPLSPPLGDWPAASHAAFQPSPADYVKVSRRDRTMRGPGAGSTIRRRTRSRSV